MITKFIDITGKTEEEAVLAGLEQLGLTRDEVSVEIIERAKRGVLGIGGCPAVVRLSYEVEEPAEPPAPDKPAAEEKPAPVRAKPRPADASLSDQGARVEQYLRGLLELMGIEADIEITEREGGGVSANLSGKGMGAVIGRRGETLDAIQHLVNYSVNRGNDKRLHISVDAENYRSKREDSLVHLAEKMAEKAVKYKRSMALEPMNSYERHVIHTALQDYEGVTTASTGVEPNRRVVVSYVKPDKPEPPKTPVPPKAPEKTELPESNKPSSREWA
jgi:spoIIIJ-associated protein